VEHHHTVAADRTSYEHVGHGRCALHLLGGHVLRDAVQTSTTYTHLAMIPNSARLAYYLLFVNHRRSHDYLENRLLQVIGSINSTKHTPSDEYTIIETVNSYRSLPGSRTHLSGNEYDPIARTIYHFASTTSCTKSPGFSTTGITSAQSGTQLSCTSLSCIKARTHVKSSPASIRGKNVTSRT
jgi:hypothetical protein